MLFFDSENWMDCKNYYWESLGLWDGMELGIAKLVSATQGFSVKAEQWTKAKSLYLSGKTWGAISSDLGLNQSTLLSKASREGLPKVRKEMRNTISPKENQSLESLSILVRNRLASDAVSTLERIDSYDLDGIKDESTREQILGSLSKRSALVFGWSESGESPSVSINLLGSMPDKLFNVEKSHARED
jgi:hypothetical protein